MTAIPVRQLSQHTSEIVKRAEAGESFVVTKNGRPVAQVIPISPEERHFEELVDQGVISHRGAEPGWIRDWEPIDLVLEGPSLSDTLLAMRDKERW